MTIERAYLERGINKECCFHIDFIKETNMEMMERDVPATLFCIEITSSEGRYKKLPISLNVGPDEEKARKIYSLLYNNILAVY